jgi:hypothetical protein
VCQSGNVWCNLAPYHKVAASEFKMVGDVLICGGLT